MSSDPRPGPSGPDTPPPAEAANHAAESILGSNVSRRSFLRSAGLSAAAAAATGGGAVARGHQVAPAAPAGPDAPSFGPAPAPVAMQVNGQSVAPAVEPASSLLETLRNELGLTGSKQVCDRASCGGCTVLVDGEPVASCMMLTHDAEGRDVRTIEGLRQPDGSLHPLQESFIRHDALQCGYCTPGFVMAAVALLEQTPKPALDEIKQGLAGNICRCGTYTNIFNAVLEASGQSPIVDGGGDR